VICGNLCFVRNDYEAYEDSERKKPLKQGTNLICLASAGEKWKVVSMLWEDDVRD